MDSHPLHPRSADGAKPVTEADLHAYADQLLDPARHAEIDAYLRAHAADRERVDDWRAQNLALRQMLDPVMSEPLPLRLPLQPATTASGLGWQDWPWRSLVAGVAIAVVSTGLAWWGRGVYDGPLQRGAALAATQPGTLHGFALRAAVAHGVYSPDVRRPVEVGADQEQALVTWLTKRMGAEVRPPDLRALGYGLIGGRLLPGDKGPVAQFMFEGAQGERLTLYITREEAGRETAFRFGQDGPVNVFYWVDQDFGYALSSGENKQKILRVAQTVYGQLEASR
ncbi:anti-sigma factor family protein [Acidovorax sp. NCPPB 4044]|uniref:anti-sigma factor family protein n=1 Tax=Acidovorax sp. NCPPB 4044 TaxID=2940490 RepID=UPI002302F002|nr:anti-sigma factor [Acidovorax sp. NCPPB 4044]MDA8520147.1 anti-sigma factor [Acidovorax sp. NCPPB 4044]